MTIAQNIASKLAVALVAVAMIFMAVAPSARAATQTPEELQKTINDLLAQVAALQAQTGGSSSSAGKACGTFSMDLKKGATGADVKALQAFLNSDADTMVAATGVGSKGMETMSYGPMTAAAVSKFQVKYRAEILTPAGLVNPTGFFGPSTRAQANKLCAGGSTTDNSGGSTGGTKDTTLGGEADLNDVTVDSADKTDLEEGNSQVDLGSVTVNFKNGDAKIDRLDIKLKQTSGSEAHPWKAFDTLYVMVDGKEVASKDVSARADYLDDTAGTVRLSGLNIVAKEDKDVVITIAADLQKGGNNLNNWTLSAEGLRYFDASGVATTEDSQNDLRGGDSVGSTADFTIDESGTQDELIVKTNSSNPSDSTLEVKDNAKSDWYTTLVFDLDTKDSTNDITLNDIFVDVAHTSGVSYSTLVDDARITIDGKVIDSSISDVASSTNTTAAATIDFNVDGDVVISAGDRVEAKVELKFKSLAPANEGKTVTTSVTSVNADKIDAEGSDTLTTSQLSGSAQGKVMTLRTKGVDASASSMDAVRTTASISGGHDYVTYTLKYEVTAFNQDLYFSKNAATSTAYELTDSSGNGLGNKTNTSVESFTSTANDTDAPGYFHVAEGDTETFTLVIKWSPGAATAARGIQLDSLKYAETATYASLSTWTAAPATDYRTSAVSTNN